MKKKLLSPLELKEFRLQQEKQRELRAAELAKKNKKLTSPKKLLDPSAGQNRRVFSIINILICKLL